MRVIRVEVFATQEAEVPIYRGHFSLDNVRVEFAELLDGDSLAVREYKPLFSVTSGPDDWDQLSFWIDDDMVYMERPIRPTLESLYSSSTIMRERRA